MHVSHHSDYSANIKYAAIQKICGITMFLPPHNINFNYFLLFVIQSAFTCAIKAFENKDF